MRQCANKVCSHEQAGNIGTLARLLFGTTQKEVTLRDIKNERAAFTYTFQSKKIHKYIFHHLRIRLDVHELMPRTPEIVFCAYNI